MCFANAPASKRTWSSCTQLHNATGVTFDLNWLTLKVRKRVPFFAQACKFRDSTQLAPISLISLNFYPAKRAKMTSASPKTVSPNYRSSLSTFTEGSVVFDGLTSFAQWWPRAPEEFNFRNFGLLTKRKGCGLRSRLRRTQNERDLNSKIARGERWNLNHKSFEIIFCIAQH